MVGKASYEGERNLRWVRIGGCVVTYMEADVEFDEALWDRWVASFSNTRTRALLICSWDAIQPSHQQWRRATRAMRDRGLPVAVVSEARHNLALAKAASWLGTNIHSFHWSELGKACEITRFDPNLIPAARIRIVALRDVHGPVSADATVGLADKPASRTFEGSFTFSNEPLSPSVGVVEETHNEIQATLENLQKRLRSRDWGKDSDSASASGVFSR